MDNTPEAGVKRRTRSKAEEEYNLASVPKDLAIITHEEYQTALVPRSQGLPRIQPLDPAVTLTFDNGELRINGAVVSKAELVNLFTNEKVTEINVQFLQPLYTVLFQNLRQDILQMSDERELLNYTVTLYLPELLNRMGEGNTSQKQIDYYVRQIKDFSALLGIMPVKSGGKVYDNEYPVMLFHGLDRATNCISFSSPYMNKVIHTILEDTSRLYEKDGKPVLDREKKPMLKPPVTNLVKMNIVTAKNKRAAEIVNAIAVLLETAGSRPGTKPKKRVKKLIDQCPELKLALEAAGNNAKRKNNILQRAFSGAWSYIDEYTYIRECFPGIQIPNTIPTSTTLNQVLEFPHNGRIKRGETEEKLKSE